MRKTITRIAAAALAAAVLLTAAPTPVQAAKKADMKTATVSWDLKADKKITYQSYYAGVGYKDCTVQIKNLKVADASKKGYKKLTFSIVFNQTDLTSKDAHKINYAVEDKAYTGWGGNYYFAFVDYQTGKSLEEKNDKNVTVTASDWINENYKEVWHEDCPVFADGCGIWYYKTIRMKKVTVTYPASYKNLCVVVGGMTKKSLDKPNMNDEFWNGTGKFSKTCMYDKNNKKVAHAMRIK